MRDLLSHTNCQFVKGKANTIAHLDGRCVKVHVTTVCNVLKRNTLILIANPYEFTLTRTLYQSDRSLEHKMRMS